MLQVTNEQKHSDLLVDISKGSDIDRSFKSDAENSCGIFKSQFSLS